VADWQSKAVRDPNIDFNQFSVQASDSFPLLTLSCVNGNTSAVDMLQIDRLTRIATSIVDRVEVRVDSNSTLVFFPDQHKININYNYYPQLESGIETITLMPSNDPGQAQFGKLVSQFINGYSGVVRVVTETSETQIEISLLGFTQAYLSMRTDCINS